MRPGRKPFFDQRATTSDHVLELGDTQLPSKAERLLGTRGVAEARTGKSRAENWRPPTGHAATDEAYCSRGETAERAYSDGAPISQNTMPPRWNSWRNGDSKSWSTAPQESHQQARAGTDSSHPADPHSTGTSLRGQIRREPSDSTIASSYYDAAHLPSNVSQHTSASAIRDRRWLPLRHLAASASDPALAQARPLKSALKQPAQPRRTSETSTRRPRKLDISSFFLKPKSSQSNLRPSPDVTESPSSATTSELFPSGTVQVQPRRGDERFEAQKMASSGSVDSGRLAARAKVSDNDIKDSTKTNVRRPPKGIKNWFDGLDDISSEEEYEEESRPDVSSTSRSLAPVARQCERPGVAQPVQPRKIKPNSVQDNLHTVEDDKARMRQGMQRRGSDNSNAVDSAVSTNERLENQGRMAGAHLADESVLCLSSSSEDEQAYLPSIRDSVANGSSRGAPSPSLRNARSVGVSRPSMPARKLQTSRSFQRESSFPRDTVSTFQTSGSIPIRLNSDIPLPPVPKRDIRTSSSDPTAVALHRLEGGRESSDSRRHPQAASRASSGRQQEDDQSITGETNTSGASDNVHMMAVTDEEMALLEMMRKKRAAMAKNSFSEGYNLAEQQHRASRREPSHCEEEPREDEGDAENHRSLSSVPPLTLAPVANSDQRSNKKTVPKAQGTAEEINNPPLRASGPLLLPKAYNPRAKPASISRESEGETHSSQPQEPGAAGCTDMYSPGIVSAFIRTPTTESFPTPPTSHLQKPSLSRSSRKVAMSPSLIEEEPIPELSEIRNEDDYSLRSVALTTTAKQKGRINHASSTTDSSPALGSHPTGLHSNPYLDVSSLDFNQLDSPLLGNNLAPSSAGASGISPNTPTFSAHTPSDDGRSTASTTDHEYPSVRERRLLESSQRKAPTPHKMTSKPEPLESFRSVHRMGSVRSITSAGDDVLAAWADLGGGSEAFGSRRKRGG